MGQLAGGPKIPLRFGRKDVDQPEGCAPEGNLPAGGAPWPAPAKGPGDHLRNVFYRMGFNDQEIVALSGAGAPWYPNPTLCMPWSMAALGPLLCLGKPVTWHGHKLCGALPRLAMCRMIMVRPRPPALTWYKTSVVLVTVSC